MQVRPLSIIITWWTFSETLYKRHNLTLGMTGDFGGIVGWAAAVVMVHIDEGENSIPLGVMLKQFWVLLKTSWRHRFRRTNLRCQVMQRL